VDKTIEFYCVNCYRTYKTLSHFNGRHSWCVPYLRADGRRRLEVKKINGYWTVVKKGGPRG